MYGDGAEKNIGALSGEPKQGMTEETLLCFRHWLPHAPCREGAPSANHSPPGRSPSAGVWVAKSS